MKDGHEKASALLLGTIGYTFMNWEEGKTLDLDLGSVEV